jgi:hypothetical protein
MKPKKDEIFLVFRFRNGLMYIYRQKNTCNFLLQLLQTEIPFNTIGY